MNINLKEIARWARKNKATTMLSIFGMAIGISLALLIGFWSLNEFSYDKFHKDADRIYRICRQGYINNESVVLGSDFGALGSTAKQQFPAIDDMVRIRVMNREVVAIKDQIAYEDAICTTDKNLFTFFSFQLVTGDPLTCLDAPDKIVIDRYLANKYFKDEDPIGQFVKIYGQEFRISAIMENIPENSHIKFRMLIPFSGLNWLNEESWGNSDNFLTYFKLKEGADSKVLANQINKMSYEHFPTYEQFKIDHFLQPLTEIHLSSGFRFDYVITNDQRTIFILMSIATIILAIAAFNFVNLFISTSFQRAKSIGIKKINGSSRTELFLTSYIETAIYIVISGLLAFIIVVISLPYFNQLIGAKLSIDFGNYHIYLFTSILILLTVVIAGSVPVMYILRFNPEEIIRQRFKGKGVTLLQRVLVIGQFTASIMLIASSVIINKQIRFVQTKDLGFDKEQVLYFSPRNMAQNFETVRDELMKNPSIIEVTAKSCLPNKWNNGNSVSRVDDPNNDYIMEICHMKFNYAEVLDIPLVEGKNPFGIGVVDSTECLINEKAAQLLNLTDPIGKQLKVSDEIFTVAGILKDVNTKSLHLAIDPQVFLSLHDLQGHHIMMIKATKDMDGAIQSLAGIWGKYNSDTPFEYAFLDDTYGQLYRNEKVTSKILFVGMFIALFLSFMGQYAISYYATEKRIKEIGIRKVNGAKIWEVMTILNKDFVKWVIIAFVIATPIAYYAMNKWLQNFAYKTELSWWIFALAGVLALGIALLTVSWQSWKAATRNPVEALRYE